MNDPYPQDLATIDEAELGFAQPDPIVVALNRIALAIERNTAAISGQAPQPVQNRPQATLTPLPAIQGVDVQPRPACPYHGPEKVAPSKQGPGFYCQAKGGPDVNAKGYCRWHS